MGTRASNAEVARAVLSVPEVAGAFADAALLAKVREIVAETLASVAERDGDDDTPESYLLADGFDDLAALFDGAPADDSDIMPGSEFDGPVVL
jgi:hypothetical protein